MKPSQTKPLPPSRVNTSRDESYDNDAGDLYKRKIKKLSFGSNLPLTTVLNHS